MQVRNDEPSYIEGWTRGSSAEPLREVWVAAVLRPARRRPAVDGVADRRVGAEFEERLDRVGLAGLPSEMEGGHALAVVGPAEGPASVHVGAELDEAADRCDAPVGRRPSERRAALRIGVEVGAELDQSLDRLDAVALRGPHEGLVEDLLWVVGRLPGGKPPCGR
jgi:hypothetical protein